MKTYKVGVYVWPEDGERKEQILAYLRIDNPARANMVTIVAKDGPSAKRQAISLVRKRMRAGVRVKLSA